MDFFDKDGKKIELATVLASDEVKAHVATEGKKVMDAELIKVLGSGDGEPIARVAKLASNNSSLLDEKKKLEGKVSELEAKGGKADTDVEKVKTAMQAEIDAANAKAVEAEKKLQTTQFTGELRKHLSAGNVKPAMLDFVEAHIIGKGFETAGGIFTVGGKTLETYTKEFLASEAGKEFVQAAGHAGGGSGGSANGAKSTQVNPFAKGTWNLTAQAELKKTDPAAAERMKSEAESQGAGA